MRVASLREGPDGRVLVTSADRRRGAPAPQGLHTLRQALDDWPRWEQPLEAASDALEGGSAPGAFDVDERALHSPLPRAFEWAEGSTFLAHMERCRGARGAALPEGHGVELAAYEGGSANFVGPRDDIVLHDISWELDVEPTVAVITDEVPLGVRAAEVPGHVKLVLVANDWTLRSLLPREFSKGLGLYQCKPVRTFSPVAISPRDLAGAWDGRRLSAEFQVSINGTLIGRPNSGIDMVFDFGQIVEHLVRTRGLGAGSIVGSGTVSNHDPLTGIGCLAELRAAQMTSGATELTPYLVPGDEVCIDALGPDGRSLFGAMRQRIVAP